MSRHETLRVNIFFGCIILVSSLILYRLFILSYIKHTAYSLSAAAQSDNINNVLARGNIYFKDPLSEETNNLFLAATNKKFPTAHVVPNKIPPDSRNEIAEKLSGIVAADKEAVLKILNSNSSNLKVLARKISNEQVNAVKGMGLKGVGVSYEMDRFYPGGNTGADVLGFLGYDSSGRSGQYGVEAYYDSDLFGRVDDPSKAPIESAKGLISSAKGLFSKDYKPIPSPDIKINRPADLVLTIDKNIQAYIEDKAEELMAKWSATGVTIIVQDPATGKILSIVDRPTFNPNSYSTAKPEMFLNRSTQEIFEPGSSFKPFTMAAGLDLAKITPQSFFHDTGSVTVAGYTIKNFSDKIFGSVTMSQVLEKSINTGVMHVENLVGDDNFLNYVVNMGFGQKTGIDMPGELHGDITNLYSGRKINYLTASFGQGIAVTPMQLINAYSAIANGGKLMRPYVVEKIIKENGKEEITKPEIVAIPIGDKTSQKLKSMLVSVVDNGFDKARIAGYDVAGKTGTAQIPDGKGGYLENEFIHDFVGFAPAYNPKFVVLIKMDKPQGITFAADSLSPTFKDIANYLIRYFNIPPTR
ncbi:MAG: Peptidoglycan glycosyltransferase [Candidatus Yanofskybacteria bacterium GW2011_GWA1_44_21]|uniref:Penicillin-binding protein transpeptidase domain-containing protein n=2 Tax=Candidatus Yanofskyibacteriota TaxID=1752733 RepID=A0A1F8GZD8_9BACT|nr:MAG: Peptidoglycan glycosyltransferase [Candidatus Yanofskybacteria bacterium GW2011_GWA2_44_10]KKT50213.1 MAG: Peptidoglycan glycosyltransferase [Candidatus Yanofskybacteria bacterium GW2011_GWA1_44_21]KKT90326.1 MAG: Peptidoglycan glycosyltransferase [Candidatus Yanofskybacteria bacterium GW2011_GWB1_45_11]OGN14507.1 MAG: hypothetical protein A3C01_00260 [Candidatus Yanofskybacteria bacterium RIFCSPHIGHO2_02_FULL_44_36b]OGN30795.1 MAG: hypothetical protein A3I96_03105 [Candidatus Yanofskyb